ncbi:MAG: hypothetical protein J5781_01730, partial [Clostridia bacterium]|nr:hypothetical protein [Clostridia bacterium]
MKSKYLKFGILILCVVLALCIVACSDRKQEENGEVIDNGGSDVLREPILDAKRDVVFKHIISAMEHAETSHIDVNPYWFCINTVFTFRLRTYEQNFDGSYSTSPNKFVNYKLSVLADIALVNDEKAAQTGKVPNANSCILIELQDINHGYTVLGFYYYNSTAYFSIAGKKYYTEQINISSIGIAIAQALKLGTKDEINFVSLIGNALHASFPPIMVQGADIAPLIPTLLWGNIFDSHTLIDYSSETTDFEDMQEDKKVKIVEPTYEYVRQYFEANKLLGMLHGGTLDLTSIGLGALVPPIEISWEAFGLPDLDQILEDTIGFSLRTIMEKNWPQMTVPIYAINEIKEVEEAGGIVRKYVFNGFGIDITTDTGEYDVQIQTVPFRFGLSEKDDVGINMSSYNFDSGKGSTYEKGNLANLEANFRLAVESPEGDTLRAKDLVGGLIDLGGFENVPIVLDEATSYIFDVKAAVSIDLFDNANNYLQLTYKYNTKEVFSIYLVPDLTYTPIGNGDTYIYDTLFLNCSHLKSGGETFFPNTKLSNVNLTKLATGKLGDGVMQYLDPRADISQAFVQELLLARNAADDATEESSGLDVMALIGLLIERNADDTGYKYLTLPTKT